MIDVLMGIDVGTTSTKVVLFNQNGNEIARSTSRPYQNFTPKPGWVEQDPEELWQALIFTMRDSLQSIKEEVKVTGICMAVQSGSLIPADLNGKPVYPLITWLDGRAEDIVKDWKANGVQNWVKPLSGWSLYPSLCLPTIAWLQKNNPDVSLATAYYFSLNDFLVFRLTGKLVTNPSNAGGMQLLDIQTADWSDELCELAGITTENLAEILPSGASIGEILPEVCSFTGVNPGTVLVNGGHDQVCTALGLGIIDPGKFLLACGTAWVFTGVLSSADMAHLPSSLDLNFHAVPKRWTLSQSLGGLGASFEWWFQKTFFGENDQNSRSQAFIQLNSEMRETESISDLFFLPMTGGHDDPATTRRGGFFGLQLGHSRANVARAIMEGAGFELRWALEPVLEAGIPVEKLWMVGGAAQSKIWPSILSSITGIPICIPEYDQWPALGAAILAGVGTNVFSDVQSGLKVFAKSEQIIIPNELLKVNYDISYLEYQRLSKLFF